MTDTSTITKTIRNYTAVITPSSDGFHMEIIEAEVGGIVSMYRDTIEDIMVEFGFFVGLNFNVK